MNLLTRSELCERGIKLIISIVTVFGSDNYGSILQATCLMKALEEYGDVVFSDYDTRHWNVIKTVYEKIRPFVRRSDGIGELIHRCHYEFSNAIKMKIAWKKLPSKKKYSGDLCVLGSDEIWNIRRVACRYDAFWGHGISTRKISYAVSINFSDDRDFTERGEYVEYLNQIDRISVRDSHSKEILSHFTTKEITLVLDPTLLYDPPMDCYRRRKEYIAVYLYDHDGGIPEAFRCAMEEDAHSHGLELVSCGKWVSWTDTKMTAKDGFPFSVFENAKYVLTNTFHGTAYAINYRKNLVCLAGVNPKINCLLAQFDLEDRKWDCPEQLASLLSREVDVNSINRKLSELRRVSFEYLDSVINEMMSENL